MVHTYFLYILLAAASALAAPTTRRDGFIRRQDSTDLSSDIGSGIIDEAPPATPDVVLPPIAEVFAIMAAAYAQPPSSSTSPSATADVIHLGPGLASSPTIERIEISPTVSSSQHTDPPHDNAPLAHKFIFVSVVILSMIAIVLAVYAFSYHRRHRQEKRMQMGVDCQPPEEKEKGRCSVVDISRNFPRSKFSVTSSDYPISTRSSSCESESDCSSEADSASYRDSSYGRGLMNPALFFSLRASSMASSHRHSRNGSAPVFGVPRFDARREQSRRSRSVLGGREEWM